MYVVLCEKNEKLKEHFFNKSFGTVNYLIGSDSAEKPDPIN